MAHTCQLSAMRNSLVILAVVLSVLPRPTSAKFETYFGGYAGEAVKQCLTKVPNPTAKVSCRAMQSCIFNDQLSENGVAGIILGTGTTMLGLVSPLVREPSCTVIGEELKVYIVA
jgi:hypothetical protein